MILFGVVCCFFFVFGYDVVIVICECLSLSLGLCGSQNSWYDVLRHCLVIFLYVLIVCPYFSVLDVMLCIVFVLSDAVASRVVVVVCAFFVVDRDSSIAFFLFCHLILILFLCSKVGFVPLAYLQELFSLPPSSFVRSARLFNALFFIVSMVFFSGSKFSLT